ncbi:Acyl-CoA dehydrogenase [Desulfatibacillum alkenivorans DSM 16219]|jgi:alkylation response protein AidB-like acyl-CoA dehydrogenase|uniref:Acyl-CoA dehydrogenase n=1 Tax=Desulfatibacillum alkenivorans DSM 16219 TaxID=1121393 RepID=A0A1M6F5K6_9BACT|nr:acyl-CoA dehydrogenase family protein [Desulfatibacillum alkenivorans]SHI92985.1 Acyl-CoA dehydrogenase [Desulfatibacillum alkenivorans DSM 16219]
MFAFTKAQQAIRKAAKDFAKGELDKETIIQWEKDGAFPTEVWEKAADLGFLGMHLPEKYSGGGLGMLDSVVTLEEICRKDSTVGVALGYAAHGAECLAKWGSDALKEAFLPKVLEGEMLSAGAFGESRRGGDLSAEAVTAEKEGGEWVINGQKTYVPNGGLAGFYIVLCKTGDAASLILVEADRTGLSVEGLGRKLGGNMTPTANIAFDKVRVPAGNLVGEEGKGLAYAKEFTAENKILLAAQALGTAFGAYDRMMEYVKGREQFGRKLAQFQVSQHKIADMAVKIELSALITYKAAWVRDEGKMDPTLCSMAKMTACRTAMEVSAQSIQLFGGYGFMTEYEVERSYRDAKTLEVMAGAAAVQKDIIAQSAIGRIR